MTVHRSMVPTTLGVEIVGRRAAAEHRHRRRTTQVTCTWRSGARVLSSSFISPSESRKARVDSAPWFWLTRSSWRPSQQPPVLAS